MRAGGKRWLSTGERQSLLGKHLGLVQLILKEFGPSRDDGLEMRSAKRCISCGVVRVELNRALEEVGRFVVLVAAYMRQKFTTAQHVLVGREIFGRLS